MGYEIAAGWGHAMANSGPGGLGRHADRHGRRRHLYDDELGHLFDRPQRPQDDRRRLRQRRLRGDQPAAAGQGRAGLQQSARRLPRARIAPRRFTSISPNTRSPWARPRAIARASPNSEPPSNGRKATTGTTVLSIASDAYAWVPGDADWDVGVPEVSPRESVQDARKAAGSRFAPSSASECDRHESQTWNCAHRVVERRSR